MSIVLERSDLSSFGAFLRSARERRGLTLQEIASETRIPFRHLDALEHGKLDALPGGMYRRAEVRAYADMVGLDRGVALAHLEQVLDSHENETSIRHDPPLEPAERNWTAYAALALVAGMTLWAATRWEWGAAPTPTDAAIPAAVAPAPTPSASTDQPAVAAAPPAPTRSEPLKPAVKAPDAALNAAAATTAPVAPVTTPAATTSEPALTITSAPAGARVLLDGIGRGNTPLVIRHVTPGDKRLRLVLDGYIGHEQRVRVGGSGASKDIHIDLQRAR